MMNLGKLVRLAAFASGLGLMACAAEPADADAPGVDDDALEVEDMGTTYNGWSQSLFFSKVNCTAPLNGFVDERHTLTRSSGDATRGGGFCYVRKVTQTCTADSTCVTAAQATYGATAFGYCFQNVCYLRPGDTATHCRMNPNRTAGTLSLIASPSAISGNIGVDHLLGCMTKTAGLNTACGCKPGDSYTSGGVSRLCPSDYSSLYMKWVQQLSVDNSGTRCNEH